MEWTPATRAALCRKIGVMYQSGALFGSMTCLENVMLPLEEFTSMKKRERRDRARELLADVELSDSANLMPSEISGGMRKRVAIARAMALDPEVVFLDEPYSGLDPHATADMYETIHHLNKHTGITIIMVTHDIGAAVKYASCVLHMGERPEFFGSVSEYRQSSAFPISRGADDE